MNPLWRPVTRPLSESERRAVRAKIRRLAERGRRAPQAALAAAAIVVAILWLWTLVASDAPWYVITGFWIVLGGAIALWARRDMVKHGGDMQAMAARLESALARNAADVYDVHATGYAEIEEIEDEGACYAFAIGEGRIAFIEGQEFYAGARFPSLDFSLVYILDEAGQPVDMLIDKRGSRTPPTRVVSSAVKRTLDVPAHLELRLGTLEELERVLQRRDDR
jgi:hypothetical protein